MNHQGRLIIRDSASGVSNLIKISKPAKLNNMRGGGGLTGAASVSTLQQSRQLKQGNGQIQAAKSRGALDIQSQLQGLSTGKAMASKKKLSVGGGPRLGGSRNEKGLISQNPADAQSRQEMNTAQPQCKLKGGSPMKL